MERFIHIGCSGYYYPQWKGKFYPLRMPTTRWLEFYGTVFNTVELNGTFYRQPKPADLKKYVAATPENFVFAAKASRYITHILRMRQAAESVRTFISLLEEGLGDKFARLLFQLPPTFVYSEENLDAICAAVPPGDRYVIEFRHSSWWNRHTLKRFREQQYTLCNVDYPGMQPPFEITSSCFYLRMHGVPELFKSSYSDLQLAKLAKQLPETENVHVYFNNTYYEAAFRNALLLRKELGEPEPVQFSPQEKSD